MAHVRTDASWRAVIERVERHEDGRSVRIVLGSTAGPMAEIVLGPIEAARLRRRLGVAAGAEKGGE